MADRVLSAQIGADIGPAEKSLGALAKLLNDITDASRAAVEARTRGISKEMTASARALEQARQALKSEISKTASSDREARQTYDDLLKAHREYLKQREQAAGAFAAAEKKRNEESLKDTRAEYAERERAYRAYLQREAQLAKAAAQSEAQARQTQAKKDAEYTKIWLDAEKKRNEASLKDARAYWNEQDRMRAEWKAGMEQAARAAETSAGRTAQAIREMGGQAVRELKQKIGEAYQYVKGYDKLLTSIAIVTGEPGEKEQVGERLEQMAKDLRVESTEIAGGVEEIVRQGVADMDQAEARAASIVKFSKVAGIEFGEAVEIITASANNLDRAGETTEQTVTRVADVFAYLGDATATGANEVGVAMQRTAGTARSVGATLERTASQIAVVSAQTREAPETIGRAMNSIYTRIQKVTQKGFLSAQEAEDGVAVSINDVAKALEQAGVVAYTAGGGFRDMDSVLEELAVKWPALDSATRSYVATTMAGTMQMNRFLVMMDNYDDVMNLTGQAMNAAGTTAQKYGIWMQGVEAAGNGLKAAMQDLYSELLKSSDLKAFYDGVAGIVNALTQLIKISGGAIPKVAALAAALILLSRGFFAVKRASMTGSFANGLINITRALFGVQTASIAAAGGMTALQVATGAIVVTGIIAGVSALVGWISSMGNEAEKAAEKLQETRDAIEGIDANINTAQGLAAQLEEIGEKSSYTAEETELLNSVREQLLEMSPDIAEAFGLESEQLKTNVELMRDLTAATQEYLREQEQKKAAIAAEGLDAARTVYNDKAEESVIYDDLFGFRVTQQMDMLLEEGTYADLKYVRDRLVADADYMDEINAILEKSYQGLQLTSEETAKLQEYEANYADYVYLEGLEGQIDQIESSLEGRMGELKPELDKARQEYVDMAAQALIPIGPDQDLDLMQMGKRMLSMQDFEGRTDDEIKSFIQEFYGKMGEFGDELRNMDQIKENFDETTFDQAAYETMKAAQDAFYAALQKAGLETEGFSSGAEGILSQWETGFLDGILGDQDSAGIIDEGIAERLQNKLQDLGIDNLHMRETLEEKLRQAYEQDKGAGFRELVQELLNEDDAEAFKVKIAIEPEISTDGESANWDSLKEQLEAWQSMGELYSQVAGGEGLSDEQKISLMEQMGGLGLDPERHEALMEMLNAEGQQVTALAEIWGILRERYEAAAESMGVNVDMGSAFGELLADQNRDFSAATLAIRKLSDGFELTADELKAVNEEMSEVTDATMAYAKGGKKAEELTEDLAKAMSKRQSRKFAETIRDSLDAMEDAEAGTYEYNDALESMARLFDTGMGDMSSLDFVVANLDNIRAAANGSESAFRSLQEAAWVHLVGTSEVDFSQVMGGMATVQDVGLDTAQALAATGMFKIVPKGVTYAKYIDPSDPYMGIETAIAEVDMLVPTVDNPLKGLGGSSGGGGRGGGGGGGGGGKSKSKTDEKKDVSKGIQDKLDKVKKQFEAMDYRLEINRAWQEFYEARGELSKTLPYMEQEIDLLKERQNLYAQNGKEMRGQAQGMKEEIQDTEDLITAYTARRNKYRKNSKSWKDWNNRIKKLKDNLAQLEVDYEAVNEAAQEYTLEEIKAKTEIEEVNEAIKEQRNAIRQLQIDMKQTISDYLSDIKDRDREVLDATISMQDEIMEVLRRQAEKEFELNQEKLEDKKAALEEELSAIRENFEEARRLAEENDAEEQLEEKRRKLSSMMTDPDKAKERAQLEQEIAELQQQLAWEVAEEEIAAREEKLQSEIDAIDQEMEAAQEAYDKLSEYSQEMVDQMNEIMSQSGEKVVEWLQKHSEDYAHATAEAQTQMTQDWQETMNTARDIIETNWDEVEKLMSQGMDAVIEVLKDTTGFREVGKLQGQAMVDEFKDQWNEMVNAQKQPEKSELPDASLGAEREEPEQESGFIPNGKLEPGDEASIKSGAGGTYVYTSYTNAKKNRSSGRNGLALQDADARVVKVSSDKNYVQVSGEFYDPKTYVKKDMLGWLHKKYLKGYALGGIADFTGPAWLDGSPARPERILSASQTEAFDRLVFTLDRMWRAPVMDYELPAEGGWHFEPGSVVIQVNGADGELDYEEIGEEVMRAIYEKYRVRR